MTRKALARRRMLDAPRDRARTLAEARRLAKSPNLPALPKK